MRYLLQVTIDYFYLIIYHIVDFLTTGGDGDDFNHNQAGHQDGILKFDKTSLQWTQVGSMTRTRYCHAMSAVNVADIQDYCT